MNYVALQVWLVDDSVFVVPAEHVNEAARQLFKYAREGSPRFVELGKNQFYAASNIASFNLAEEEAE
nr:hypothetical protein [uncultured Trichococcus sp.]